jgi:DNA-binding transcriptional ArsR family regulator
MSVDQMLAALADPTRRRLLEALSERPGSSATTLAVQMPVSRQAVARHLAVLRESELVTSGRVGKEVLFAVCPEQLEAVASWMTMLAATWHERLRLLKEEAERGQPPSAT